MSRLCVECGARAVEPKAVEGRTSPFRQFDNLPVPADLPIPTCAACGAERYDRQTSERLDEALAVAAADRLSGLAVEALDALAPTMNQRELEVLLGLSAGYLSKVRHGKERPSGQLVAALVMLAVRPVRCQELERVWETGLLPPRLAGENFARVEQPLLGSESVAL